MPDDVKAADMEAARNRASWMVGPGIRDGDRIGTADNLARAFQQLDAAAGVALAALERMKHGPNCGVLFRSPCDCGRDAAITALRNANVQPPAERGEESKDGQA